MAEGSRFAGRRWLSYLVDEVDKGDRGGSEDGFGVQASRQPGWRLRRDLDVTGRWQVRSGGRPGAWAGSGAAVNGSGWSGEQL